MKIKEILNELAEFSPELYMGYENLWVDRLADHLQSYYDENAVYVCDDLPLHMPSFKNCGTLIVSEELLPFVPSLVLNVIVVKMQDMEAIKRRLETVLDF